MAQVYNLNPATPDSWVLDFCLDVFPAAMMGQVISALVSPLPFASVSVTRIIVGTLQKECKYVGRVTNERQCVVRGLGLR